MEFRYNIVQKYIQNYLKHKQKDIKHKHSNKKKKRFFMKFSKTNVNTNYFSIFYSISLVMTKYFGFIRCFLSLRILT